MDESARDDLMRRVAQMGKSERAELSRALQLLEAAKSPTAGEVMPTPEELEERYRLLSKEHDFDRGMLIEWKPGMQNRKRPEYGQPAVVVEVLTRPVLSTTDESGSPYFQEPLNLIAGILDSEGDFLLYHFDKRRFQPFVRGQ